MSTLLLCNFNGSDGSTTFTDEVPGVSWTANGSAQLDTAIKKFGSASLYLPTWTDYPYATGYSDPSGGSFTLEGWFYCASGAGGAGASVAIHNPSGPGGTSIDWDSGTSQIGIHVEDSGGNDLVSSYVSCTISRDAWHHIALVRDNGAGTWAAYLDGTRYVYVSAGNPGSSLSRFDISNGCVSIASYYDSIRLTNEVKYSGATYTVPTAEFSIVATGSAAVSEGADTGSASGTLWYSGWGGAGALSIAATASMERALVGSGEINIAATMAPAIQGLVGTATLSLSGAANMIRPDPLIFGGKASWIDIVATPDYLTKIRATASRQDIKAEPSR